MIELSLIKLYQKIIEIKNHKIKVWNGNYTEYILAKKNLKNILQKNITLI